MFESLADGMSVLGEQLSGSLGIKDLNFGDWEILGSVDAPEYVIAKDTPQAVDAMNPVDMERFLVDSENKLTEIQEYIQEIESKLDGR